MSSLTNTLPPKIQINSSNSTSIFLNFLDLEQQSNYDCKKKKKKSKSLLEYVFRPVLNGSFFFGGGRRFILPCQEECLKKCTKLIFGTFCISPTSTWPYKCSPSWHAHTTIVHYPLVLTDKSKPTCV